MVRAERQEGDVIARPSRRQVGDEDIEHLVEELCRILRVTPG